jgi:glycosyltransferase involved in cell wall biosynthesis
MACGVTCVATHVGDTGKLIGDTGILVPVDRPKRLAEAWLRILMGSKEEKMRLRIAATKRVANDYDIKRIVHRYESFYMGLLEHDLAKRKH